MNDLKHVELIRARVARGLEMSLISIKGFVSTTDGNNKALERLSGETSQINEKLLAMMIDMVMEQMGHKTAQAADKAGSRSRRVVNGSRV